MKKFLILFLFLFIINAINAENMFKLEDIEIRADSINEKESFFPVERIYGQNLDYMPEISEVLRYNTVFDFRDFSGYGSLLTASSSGVRSRQTLKTFEGVKLNSFTTGDFDMSLMEAELISSISAVKTPVSSIYGSSGGGGLIELRGKSFSENEYGVKFGTNNYKKIYYNFMPSDNTLIFTSYKEFDNNMDFSSGRQNSHFIKYKDKKSSIMAYYTDKFKYTLGPLSFLQPGNYQDDELWLLSYNYNIDSNFRFKTTLNKLQNIFYNNSLKVENPTETENLTFEIEYENSYFKLSYANENIDGDTTQYSDTNFDGSWDSVFSYKEESTVNSLRFESEPLENIFVSLSFGDHDEFDSNISYNIGYAFNKNLINFSKGVCLPTYNDLYWPDTGFVKGNTDLDKETSTSINYSYNADDFGVSLYRIKYNDLIDWQQNPVNFKWAPKNISKATIEGFKFDYNINNSFKLGARFENTSDGEGNNLTYREKRSASLKWQLDSFSQISLLHTGKRNYDKKNTLPGVTTWNYFYLKDDFFLNIRNIFDKNYVLNNDYPEEERNVMFGVVWTN
ncbi:MAG: TonB-dependent receptor plug domain-containing protein [Candidatus Muiribacteriota bacterium]